MTELKQYYRSIEKKLPAGSHKKRFMQELKASVGDWLEQNPNADLNAVQSRFGAPERIAADYAGEMDTQEIIKKCKLRKWIISIVAGAAALALVIWLVFTIAAYIKLSNDHPGFIEVGPAVEEQWEAQQ